MDNLTHTLTGLMLARAGVSKGVPRAAALMMVAANAPDFDVVSWFGGATVYLQYHRWITHAVIALPVMAVVSVLIIRLFARSKSFPWVRAIIAAAVAVGSHLLLDWTNTYGIRLLLPFSKQWLRLDITNIVDLWIWVALAVAVIAPALAGLVGSEIGAKSSGAARGWAVFALLFLFGYEYGRFVLHNRAVAVLDSRMYDGSTPSRVAALPGFANPFLWRGIVETPDAYRILEVNLAGSFDPAGGELVYKPQAVPAFDAVRNTEAFRVFLDFSAFPLWRAVPVEQPEGGTRVEVSDLRFGDPREPRFTAAAVVTGSNVVKDAGFSFGPVRPK